MTREKNGKFPGISQKEGKSVNFHSITLFLKKKNCKVRFCLFSRKNKTLFLNFQQLRKYIS